MIYCLGLVIWLQATVCCYLKQLVFVATELPSKYTSLKGTKSFEAIRMDKLTCQGK